MKNGKGRRLPMMIATLLIFSGVGCPSDPAATPEDTKEEEAIATFHPAVPHIIAIGDVHGDLDATRRALRLGGAIDADDHWIGGDLVVVQTGDQLDRGNDEQQILDLFEELIQEARAAGGAMHILNGNHELMNAALDLRYVTEEGFVDFQDAVEVPADDAQLEEFDEAHRARVVAFRPGGKYARLLAKRNVAVQIGDNVFVHGGVLPHHIEYGLERLNREAQVWLRGEGPIPKFMSGSDGPIWTRTYSSEPDAEDCKTLTLALETLSAKRMIVGHTVQESGIETYCDDRVWCIDVGMSAHYGGDVQVLSIRGNDVTILREG